jgi:zinc/manganese transport system substrate-binding protein
MERRLLPLMCLLSVVVASAMCSASANAAVAPLHVVAAENFWGSIASQLGGSRVQVTSIITNPATDPHEYEPTASDARTLAGAQLVIENGIGYDPWAAQLLAANPVQGRLVLNVGDLVGIEPGGNPHRWYSPTNVQQVISVILADYKQLDPKDSAYFNREKVNRSGNVAGSNP